MGRLKLTFIAGYKRHATYKDTYWLCNHPESTELIFSTDESKAFMFTDEQSAMQSMEEILAGDNRPGLSTVVKNISDGKSVQLAKDQPRTLKEMEAKVQELLKLFNDRNTSKLELLLTLNQRDNTLRGYGVGLKLGDAVDNFVALLAIKGIKAEVVEQNTFIVKMENLK